MLHDSGTLLLAAAAGYWVLEQAQTQKKNLKRVGRFLGWTIIVVSLVGMACRIWVAARSCSMTMSPGGRMCPFPSKSFSHDPADIK